MAIGIIGDPFSALGDFFTGLIRTGKLVQAFKACLSIAGTLISSFLGACGYQLWHEHANWPVAIGYGMVVSAGAINALFVLSPLLRGCAIATFKPVVSAVDPSKFEVIDRSKEK